MLSDHYALECEYFYCQDKKSKWIKNNVGAHASYVSKKKQEIKAIKKSEYGKYALAGMLAEKYYNAILIADNIYKDDKHHYWLCIIKEGRVVNSYMTLSMPHAAIDQEYSGSSIVHKDDIHTMIPTIINDFGALDYQILIDVKDEEFKNDFPKKYIEISLKKLLKNFKIKNKKYRLILIKNNKKILYILIVSIVLYCLYILIDNYLDNRKKAYDMHQNTIIMAEKNKTESETIKHLFSSHNGFKSIEKIFNIFYTIPMTLTGYNLVKIELKNTAIDRLILMYKKNIDYGVAIKIPKYFHPLTGNTLDKKSELLQFFIDIEKNNLIENKDTTQNKNNLQNFLYETKNKFNFQSTKNKKNNRNYYDIKVYGQGMKDLRILMHLLKHQTAIIKHLSLDIARYSIDKFNFEGEVYE